MRRLILMAVAMAGMTACAQTNTTTVQWILRDWLSGANLNRTLTIASVQSQNPRRDGVNIVGGTARRLVPTNGVVTANLWAGDYLWQIDGLQAVQRMSVYYTNVVMNVADLTTALVTYSYTNPPATMWPQFDTNGAATAAAAKVTNGLAGYVAGHWTATPFSINPRNTSGAIPMPAADTNGFAVGDIVTFTVHPSGVQPNYTLMGRITDISTWYGDPYLAVAYSATIPVPGATLPNGAVTRYSVPVSGVNLTDGTLSSNKLDTATLAMFGTGGGTSGAVTNNDTRALTLTNLTAAGTFTGNGAGLTNIYASSNMLATVTPEMFGAVGDGIADDSAAIQSSLNWASTLGNKRPAVVSMSPVTNYLCGTNLYINGSLKLVGNAVVRAQGTQAKTIVFTGTNGIVIPRDTPGISIEGLSIFGPGIGQNSCGIFIPPNADGLLDQVTTIKDCTFSGFKTAIWTTNTIGLSIEKVNCDNCTYGLVGGGSYAMDCRVFKMRGACGIVINGGNWLLDSCDMNNQGADLTVYGGAVSLRGCNFEIKSGGTGPMIVCRGGNTEVGLGMYLVNFGPATACIQSFDPAKVFIGYGASLCSDASGSQIKADAFNSISSIVSNVQVTNISTATAYTVPLKVGGVALGYWGTEAVTGSRYSSTNTGGNYTEFQFSGGLLTNSISH